jgi:hypothetical protein
LENKLPLLAARKLKQTTTMMQKVQVDLPVFETVCVAIADRMRLFSVLPCHLTYGTGA